ncbi:DUF421 domain-containing protein [Corynebacterium sp. 4HC-13]|uniref:DUF421 domain-containing protein n=2 Tax=Corynebacterium anserum TaxID=2684406 RepID=A0A7G7YRD0_9CORY|nr:DUF421 domain-containing protein [Corynebacterium anserum]QNH97050.1 DUF421 domain-containing protein [Corynebacterium anserum]
MSHLTPPLSSTSTGAETLAVQWTPPAGWADTIGLELGIEAWRIPLVIASGVLIYLMFLVFVRIFGPRILGKLASFDAVVIVMFGAVAGRVIIGHPPTLAAGVIGLLTLICMEAAFGAVQDLRGIRHAISGNPIVLVAHGRFVAKNMRKAHVTKANIYAAARRSGITCLEQVKCIILEPTGELSIIREGTNMDPEMLTGVVGRDLI